MTRQRTEIRRAAVAALPTRRGGAPVVETLEGRQLMAAQPTVLQAAAQPAVGLYARRDVVNPSVAVGEIEPADGQTNVRRDAFVHTALQLPNGGLDPATVRAAGNITLVRDSDGVAVAGEADTSGGGDAITFTPAALLAANTKYRFTVTAGVLDVTGVPMTPYTSTFTTGTAGGEVNATIGFTKAPQAAAAGKAFTCVTVGPDGKLYATTYDGLIYRWNVGTDGTLGGTQVIGTIGATRTITSIVFAPGSTATNLVAFVTHTQKADFNGTDFTGKITRLSGPNLGIAQDYVTNLPRSVRDHLTNQAAFGPDGALYVAQAASNAMGAPDSSWGNRAEHILTAAILRVDVAAIAAKGTAVNVKTTDAGGTYNPYAAGAPVTLYATGVRNGYDVVWHSNGHLYTAVNGSAAGGNTPAIPGVAPAMTNVRQTEDDWLFDVKKGGYYGHPNPARKEYVYNGGNPKAGVDPQEVSAYPVGVQPSPNWRKAAYDFGRNYSPDGMIEYKSGTFGGALKGKLLVVRYSGGDDIIGLSPKADGSIDATKTLTAMAGATGFADPVDLTEYVNPSNPSDPRNGMLFVAEYGGQKITLLRPKAPSTAGPTVAGLTLMDAGTDAPIGPLADYGTIDLSGTRTYTVRAEPGPTGIGSVVFSVDGTPVRTENYAPYVIGSKDSSFPPNLMAWTVPTGAHTLTVVAYAGKDGTGAAGAPLVVHFTGSTTPPPAFGVTNLILVDATTDKDVGPLVSGSIIDFTGGKKYSVRAVVAGTTKSVAFKLDGTVIRTESGSPFTVGGDAVTSAGTTDYLPWTVANGPHTLVAAGFAAGGGTGALGATIQLDLTVVGVGATTPPAGTGKLTGVNVNGATGSTTAGAAGAWTVKGGGYGINGTKDQIHYAQQDRTGDFDVKVKVASLTGGAGGLVVRSGTLGSNSQVAILLNAGTLSFGSRATFGAAYTSKAVGTGTAGNVWLRIKRVGNAFTAYYGTNGTAWTQAGTVTVSAMPPALKLGLVAMSGVTTSLATAKFEGLAG